MLTCEFQHVNMYSRLNIGTDIKFSQICKFSAPDVIERYKCYDWTSEDLTKFWIDGIYHFELEDDTCEAYPGHIFTRGDDTKAPGCGGCWCCQPAGCI